MSRCKYIIHGEYSKTDIENVIDEWVVGRNAIRNKEVLRLRFVDGYTYEEIAEMTDISTLTVKHIISTHCLSIEKHLNNDNVH